MRDYELVLIISPEVADDAIEGAIERVKGFIAASGGEVSNVNVWGRRAIAFPIKHFRYGIYAVLTVNMSPSATKDLERSLKLSENILRHLLVRVDQPTAKPAAPVEPPAEPVVVEEQVDDGRVTE